MATLYRWVAAILALAILVQALLAGQGWFIDPGLLRVHGWVGNATFVVAVVLTGLALATRRLRTSLDLGLVVVTLVLVIAQIGLGYAGRESTGAASWHVPNGVLVFGSSVVIFTRAIAPRVPAVSL
jgi:predicted permease